MRGLPRWKTPEIRVGEQSALTDFGFTGQRLDSSTGGLMYYGARYYLPSLRRFISADTIVPGAANPQALNRYSYVLNSPLTFIDPTGHVPMIDGQWTVQAAVRKWPSARSTSSGSSSQATSSPSPASAVIEGLQAIANHNLNPRTAAFHDSVWGAVESLRWGAEVGVETTRYMAEAATEGRWEDVGRAVSASFRGNLEFEARVAGAWGQMNLNAWATPVRLFTTDIPEFAAAVNERGQGLGRGWDVALTGVTVLGDVAAIEGIGYAAYRSSPIPTRVELARRISTGGVQVSGDFPLTASPDALLYRTDPSGTVTNYQTYDTSGLPIMRVDLVGRSHGDIPTPHTHEYVINTNPSTGGQFVNTGPTRPAFPFEVPWGWEP